MPSKTTELTLEALQAAAQKMMEPHIPAVWDMAMPSPGVMPAPVPGHLGLTSKLASGSHIIMWDFDNKSLDFVESAIKANWNFQATPAAYIVQSSADAKHFHVYIFMESSVSAGHKYADSKHNAHSNHLGFRTLRVTPKNSFTPRVVSILKGGEAIEEVSLSQLTTFIVYSSAYGVPEPSGARYTISTYDLMQAVKFLQQLETAQKTKEVPDA